MSIILRLDRVIDGIQKTTDGLARTGGERYEEYKRILEELKLLR